MNQFLELAQDPELFEEGGRPRILERLRYLARLPAEDLYDELALLIEWLERIPLRTDNMLSKLKEIQAGLSV
jgi:hypothetical protein